jgi:hypothetical protein
MTYQCWATISDSGSLLAEDSSLDQSQMTMSVMMRNVFVDTSSDKIIEFWPLKQVTLLIGVVQPILECDSFKLQGISPASPHEQG